MEYNGNKKQEIKKNHKSSSWNLFLYKSLFAYNINYIKQQTKLIYFRIYTTKKINLNIINILENTE